jgi:MYXO-CTERM domain-containing protein
MTEARPRTTTVAVALAFAVLASGLGGLGGCSDPGATGAGDEVDDGSLKGELAVYVADDFEGGSQQTRYALRLAPGVERPLVFDGAVDLAPGTSIKVWGSDSEAGLHVSSFRQMFAPRTTIAQVSSPLVNGTPYAARALAFVLIDLGSGVNITSDMANVTLNTDPASIRNYYLNDSYGRQDINAQIFGPITYTMPDCSNASTSKLATDLRPMIPGTFQHYLWYFGKSVSACGWGGLGEVGTADKPANDTWYNGQTNCNVLVQEPGHNFGMQHSSSLQCKGAPFVDDPNAMDTTTNPATPICTPMEYGDVFDPMGTPPGGSCRHMNAWQKNYQGWFGGCNGVSVTQTGTFTLLPFESRCDGAQFLKVKAARTRVYNRPAGGGGNATMENLAFYYVELRTPLDFDGTLGNRTALTPQILIHVGDDLRGRTQRGDHTFLLDMTPTTPSRSDAALALNQTFTDPAGGVSITTMAVSATQATIQVMITGGSGDPTCLDGTTFAAPGPGPESCGASTTTGAGGTAGTTGAGGAAGATGAGGAAGTGGGMGGRGGAGGARSDGGAGSGGPDAGSMVSGTGGMVGGSGAGGAVVGGTGGKGGTAGGGAGGVLGGTGAATGGLGHEMNPGTVVGGCACDLGGGRAPAGTSWLIGLGSLALAGFRRRRR